MYKWFSAWSVFHFVWRVPVDHVDGTAGESILWLTAKIGDELQQHMCVCAAGVGGRLKTKITCHGAHICMSGYSVLWIIFVGFGSLWAGLYPHRPFPYPASPFCRRLERARARVCMCVCVCAVIAFL